jgi:regulator of protease activity HflC (stomatin/prohibitin superfamily)
VGDALVRLAEWLRDLWPFRKVEPWQRGTVVVFGRYWRAVGPGVYPVIPWFIEIDGYSVVPAVVSTPRLDIELKDGTAVSFVAAITLRVADVERALLRVSDYEQTTVEAASAALAERLAEVETAQLAPERRGRLLASLRKRVQDEVAEWGVEVTNLRFTTFVTRPRFYRVLGDSPLTSW